MRCPPIVYRVMRFAEPGDTVPRHTHNFAHATIGVRGLVRVNLYREGALEATATLGPRESLHVPADAEHEVVSIAPDSEAWCVFVDRGTDGDAA